ncbi:hypothetical protein BGZ92_006124 [Podila epicladia]|nr:hypothetical protein BGZ92_006124 [Podila epicladia]
MIATVVSPGSIPDFVHPPVPGESHDLYGDSHLDSIKLPAPSIISSSSNTYLSNSSAPFSDPLSVDNNNTSTNSPNPQQISNPTIARESVREHASTAIVDAEQSSDAISWSKLVEACTLGHTDVVQEIIAISPALKDSIDNVSSATGMNPLHFAAARGHSEVVRILVDQAGAGVDIQDREGETALLKASYSGSLPTVCFLLKRGANVHQRDKDGWTALHNASSRGYIDIAQVLLEKGEADINARSKMGHTPLINAASKGDVAMALYFLNHANAKPFLKNNFSEAAYDVAAANSEAYLCDILQSSEKQWWKGGSSRSYTQRGWFWLTEWVVDKSDPNVDSDGWQYGKSLTEPNQVWTANAPTSGGNWVRRRKWIRVMKKRVDMDKSSEDPLIDDLNLDVPEPASEQGDYVKRASLALRADDGFADVHQELSRYRQAIQILLRGIKADKNVSSRSAATTLVQEYLEHSEQLSETIQNRAAYRGVSDLEAPMPQIASPSTQGNPGSPNELRRLTLLKSRPSDIDITDALQDQGTSHEHTNHSEPGLPSSSTDLWELRPEEHSSPAREQESSLEQAFESSVNLSEPTDVTVVLEANENTSDSHPSSGEPTEPLATIPRDRQDQTTSTPITSDPFPMARLTRSPRTGTPSSTTASSSSSSSNTPSVPIPPPQHFAQHQAAIEASSPAVLSSSGGSQNETFFDARTGESPQTSPAPVSTSSLPQELTSSSNTPHRSHSAQSPPLHHSRHHQSMSHMSMGPLPGAKWESDYKATECRECHRKFSLWLRRHHCRRCGHVVCDRCSSHRATLHPSMVVYDPSSSEAFITHQTMSRRGTLQSYRVCDSCYSALGPVRSQSMGSGSGSASSSAAQTGSHLHRSYQGTRTRHNDHHQSNNGDNTLSTSPFDNGGVYLSNHGYSGDYGAYSSSRSSSSSNIHQPTPMVRNASSSSLMSECPVCGAILAGLEGGKAAQEAHVQDCLEGKPGQGSGPINNVRYIVYKLPADSPLIDQECAICFEEFVAGRTVARLNCLCTYHRHCIHSWLQHGKACPVHYR